MRLLEKIARLLTAPDTHALGIENRQLREEVKRLTDAHRKAEAAVADIGEICDRQAGQLNRQHVKITQLEETLRYANQCFTDAVDAARGRQSCS